MAAKPERRCDAKSIRACRSTVPASQRINIGNDSPNAFNRFRTFAFEMTVDWTGS
ncbi:MAG: hypothetical protein V7704_21005 [Aurantimonas endophytica]|uniref:Uncharacterized protein n=1 Tax=Aurantimonas endophytica TaxID=1522175 RepID=A0A7W6MMY7_9HYPH|nr:hypothetical protein [Aurantimonas endophytica]MBB4001308.1 hypothetical protein [Aurantimonas endophytica]MCO6403049.1 hypothetical protein [Aurantimonas endophytica]